MDYGYPHRNGNILCLCQACVAQHVSRQALEPNTIYPDCEACHLTWDFLFNEYLNKFCPAHQEAEKTKAEEIQRVYNASKKDPRSAEVGTQYAFTLTMPPDYQPANPLPEVAKKILEYGLTNKPYEKATKWAFVLEHTDKGTPHIHGMYETPSGRRIASKYFQRYWPLWDEKVSLGHGHKGGYHKKARHNESYVAYMEKEGVIVKFAPAPKISSPLVSNAAPPPDAPPPRSPSCTPPPAS